MPVNSSKSLGFSLNSYCHVVPGKFVTLAFFPAGMVSAWFTRQFCYEEKMIAKESKNDLYAMLEENSTRSFRGLRYSLLGYKGNRGDGRLYA
jgi:xylulokinase